MNYFGFEGQAAVPGRGKLLIAGPFLNDPNFSRSVVLVCEHNDEGTIGFVLNQPLALSLSDVVDALQGYMPVAALYQGGPVEKNTLHILHRIPEVLGGIQVEGSIYWGGNYEVLVEMVKNNTFNQNDVKLFIGYSGWGKEQLQSEMEDNTWLVGNADPELIFECEAHHTWKQAIVALGQQFAYLANTPINPQLN